MRSLHRACRRPLIAGSVLRRSPSALASSQRLAPRRRRAGDRAAHGKVVYDAHCVECHGDDRQRRRPGVAPADAAAARLHRRQIQDPLDRNRQPADRRRSAALGAAGPVRHVRCRPGRRCCPTTTSATSSRTSRRSRRDSRRTAAEPVVRSAPQSPTSPESVDARRGGVREAAVRQLPRHRRARHRRHGHDVRRRLAAAAPRRRPHRAVDLPRRRDVARRLHAIPHRHVRHADAVVQGRGDRRRDVGPRQLRRVARAQAGLGDERATKSRRFYARAGRRSEGESGQARRVSRGHARLRALPLAGRRREAPDSRA